MIPADRKCQVPECQAKTSRKTMNYCPGHKKNFDIYGDPLGPGTPFVDDTDDDELYCHGCRSYLSKVYFNKVQTFCDKCNNLNALARNYNMTLPDIITLFEVYTSCQICGESFKDDRDRHIDHDHSCCRGSKTCGRCTRGVLCRSCNHMLGNAKDNIGILVQAIGYLHHYTKT